MPSLTRLYSAAASPSERLRSDGSLAIRWSVGADFKIIISQKSNAVESNHSDESDIGGIYITILEKTFFGQSILTLYKAFKAAVFTVILLLRRNTSLLPIRPWIAW